MKKVGFIKILLFLTLKVFTQETIVLTEYFSNSEQVKSRLHVLENDTTIKHGNAIFYKQIDETEYKYFDSKNHDRLIVAKGQFDNNKKVGLWEFFMKPKFYFDFNKDKLITYQLQHIYPLLAYELGIQGDVIIKYDIDKTGQFKNIRSIKGDSILVSGTINNLNKFNIEQAKNLKLIAEIIEEWKRENEIDTIKYRLE